MDLQTLTAFFMWCMIINLGVFIFWMIFLLATPDLVYRLQSSFSPSPGKVMTGSSMDFSGLLSFWCFFSISFPMWRCG